MFTVRVEHFIAEECILGGTRYSFDHEFGVLSREKGLSARLA